MRFYLLASFLLIFLDSALSQRTGNIYGKVLDQNTQEPLIGASVTVDGSSFGATTDDLGEYRISDVPTGSINLTASYIGYANQLRANIVLTSGNDQEVNFNLSEDVNTLETVLITVNKNVQVRTVESPLSLQRLGTEEIRSNPGGNFDISKVLTVLPGVGGAIGGGGPRNDLLIRGGAPNENVYYLDGIEIPVINHFATQGASGGPQGILNVSFIEDVQLSSSAFHSRYDNALSSVLQIRQREGNPDRLSGNVRLSASEFAATLEGPAGSKKTTFIASARRSYLQFLFQAIDLPIRPNYWDFQYKVTHKLNSKTTITAIGIGAIDEFTFATPRNTTPEKEYVLRAAPSINQWTYTTGFNVRRLIKDGFINVALSRNMFDNRLDRFEDKKEGDENFRSLGSNSQEIENKLRAEVTQVKKGWKYSYGIMAQYVKYNANFFSRLRKQITDNAGNIIQPEISFRFNSEIDFPRYGAFGQISKSFLNDRMTLSAGLRTDMNSFTNNGNNAIENLSPRVSASYLLSSAWTVNASIGRYNKIAPYTVLGFRDNQGSLVNRDVDYIGCNHYVAGIEYIPAKNTRITVEGFYKTYDNYPVSLRDGISLANQGAEFGAIGNEAVNSIGTGRAYGAEFFYQRTLTKNLFAVGSYTIFKSEFTGATKKLIPASWDSRHLVSAQLGYKFKKGWEIGTRYRFQGGSPFTPFDLVESQRNYIALGAGVQDFTRLNGDRLGAFSQLDLRIDKKWNFKRSTFDLFLDITNLLSQAAPGLPNFTFQRTEDNSTWATTDGKPVAADGSNAQPLILPNNDGRLLPTIGFIWEF
jgi:hypothetical protein